MNILFIEDERELREAGVAQLELHRYTVYPVSNLADAREIMADASMPVHLVLADQSLPDGQGIQFVIEMKEQFPDCEYAIVSGCLTDGNVSLLEEKEIPFFRKPLLYGKVVEEFRRAHLMSRRHHAMWWKRLRLPVMSQRHRSGKNGSVCSESKRPWLFCGICVAGLSSVLVVARVFKSA